MFQKMLFICIATFVAAIDFLAQPLETQYTPSIIPPQEKTYANIADSSHVLVVFKEPANQNDTIGLNSRSVMEYYRLKRNIPEINKFGITIDSIKVYGADTVIIDQAGELIRNKDTVCLNSLNSICDSSAWLYYKEFIETP